MKKCETDAQKTCDVEAVGKKLAGAAKNSFTKKCVGDAVGTSNGAVIARAKRRSNPQSSASGDCFASLAMTVFA